MLWAWRWPRSLHGPPGRTSRSARFCLRARCARVCGALLLRPPRRRAGGRLRRRPARRSGRARARGRADLRGRGPRGRCCGTCGPTVREFGLPREPFLRLIEANRIDQRVSAYETSGRRRALLRPFRGSVRTARARRAATSRRRGAGGRGATRSARGLRLVNSCRMCPATSSWDGSTCPQRIAGASATPRSTGRAASCATSCASRRSGRLPCSAPATSSAPVSAAVSVRGRALSREAGSPHSRRSSRRAADVFTQRPRPSRARLAREAARTLGEMTRRSIGLRRGVALDTRAREELRLRDHRAPRRQAPRDRGGVSSCAREVDDVADGDAPVDEKRGRLRGAARVARRRRPVRRDGGRTRRCARTLRHLT